MAQPPPATILAAAVVRFEVGIAALPSAIRPALAHRDVWLAHTVARNGVFAGLLDWDSAAYADQLVDLAKLEVWVFERHPETRRPFLDG